LTVGLFCFIKDEEGGRGSRHINPSPVQGEAMKITHGRASDILLKLFRTTAIAAVLFLAFNPAADSQT
jgi:hypothetical protein